MNQLQNFEKIVFPDGTIGLTFTKEFVVLDFPELAFKINNYVYRVHPINLFWKTKSGYVMKILFTEDQEIVLGLPFLKQFETVYDYDNLRIGINKNSSYISPIAAVIKNILVIFLTVVGILFFFITAAFVISIRIMTEKKKSELNNKKKGMITNRNYNTQIEQKCEINIQIESQLESQSENKIKEENTHTKFLLSQ